MSEMVKALTPEERRIVLVSQKQILQREEEVSRLFVDGILGRKFSGPLSFYLVRYEEYLIELEKME